ncbi:sensor histidine kinase [Streptomyces sp. NPDC001714]|uniref:sensor histidine kinase n=1 Tax=Streptomyces sp. NPDC001714 TaxID=3364603 RepID=UPI00367BAA7B
MTEPGPPDVRTFLGSARTGWESWWARVLLDTRFVLAGVLVCLPTLAVLSVSCLFISPKAVSSVLVNPKALPSLILALGTSLVLLALLTRPQTTLQRWRLRVLRGVVVTPADDGQAAGSRSSGTRALFRPVRLLASRITWRQLAYHLVAAPAAALGGLLVVALWLAGAAAASAYAWAWAVPGGDRTSQVGYPADATGLTAGGLILLLLAMLTSRTVARLDAGAALALLGPTRAQLAKRVENLTESRAGLADAADAERRRIERDLHDGAQQRLVSLAINLGLARATLTDLPEEVCRVLDEAHLEAKEAIAELRDLARGLHPAVLDDRGLDAALSGVAARSPVPVRLRVDLPRRPSPTVEAVAYFVVSEALANVTKHARASRVEVTVGCVSDLLRVTVTDDGVGGADAARGTGLAGLRRRVGSVDGRLLLSSPLGGPTVITAELPCGR